MVIFAMATAFLSAEIFIVSYQKLGDNTLTIFPALLSLLHRPVFVLLF
jgi:hypothetical protein